MYPTIGAPAVRRSLLAMGMALALGPGVALADAERLEADLRALFGGQGSLEIGDVSEAWLRERVTAEALRFEGDEGERLSIDRYEVRGDYDSPDEVVMEGIQLQGPPGDPQRLAIERVVLGEPSQAVPPFGDEDALQALRLGSLAIDGVSYEGREESLGLLDGTPLAGSSGGLTVERVRGESLSREAIGWLEIEGVAGAGQDLETFGSGAFSLGRLRIEGLAGLDEEGQETLNLLELNDLAVEAERLVGALASLRVDGDFDDGEGGFWIDGLQLDLARLIELAPLEERTRLRMVSKTLTNGTDELRLDIASVANWDERDDRVEVNGEGHVELHDGLRLGLDMTLPLALPDGVSPAELFADETLLSSATLLGGELGLVLAERGLFGRLATLGAAMEGTSEAQYLEQARTQATGYGMLFGPQVQAILLGLVELMEGKAGELSVSIALPAASRLDAYAEDPLGLTDKLDMRVETR